MSFYMGTCMSINIYHDIIEGRGLVLEGRLTLH